MGKAKDIREAVEKWRRDSAMTGSSMRPTSPSGTSTEAWRSTARCRATPQYLEAAEVARRVAGVTRVHNHLEVVLPPDDYRDPPSFIGANNALAASATAPEGVEATAENGNLTLTGAVKYLTQRAAAESAVSGLTGVRNIKDEIQLVFDVDPADVNRLVREALDCHRVPPDNSHCGSPRQRQHGHASRVIYEPGATWSARRCRRMAGKGRHGRDRRTRDRWLTDRHDRKGSSDSHAIQE